MPAFSMTFGEWVSKANTNNEISTCEDHTQDAIIRSKVDIPIETLNPELEKLFTVSI